MHNNTYSAPNPFPQPLSYFTTFLSYCSAPSAYLLGKLILPAQLQECINDNIENIKTVESKYAVCVQPVAIQTYDLAILDSMQIIPETQPKPMNERFFIIKFNGNGMHYENHLERFAHDAQNLDHTVIAFNYRGVGNSKKAPNNFRDLVVDGIAQVQRLLDEGVDPEKITLDGLSLGGAVATMVAKYFHDQEKKVYLWNDRSLSSLLKAANKMILDEDSTHPLIVNCSTSITSSLFKMTAWEENIASAYNSIDEKYKRYMVVAKESEQSYGDGVIPHSASLHKGVRAFEKSQHINTGYKVLSMFGPGHNRVREHLVNKDNHAQTAQNLYEDFVCSHKL